MAWDKLGEEETWPKHIIGIKMLNKNNFKIINIIYAAISIIKFRMPLSSSMLELAFLRKMRQGTIISWGR